MTLLDVQRLSSHWRKQPPLRVLVALCAHALGVKLPMFEKQEKKKYLTADEFSKQVARINASLAAGTIPNG